MAQVNKDGLFVQFALDESKPNTGGVYGTLEHGVNVTEVLVDGKNGGYDDTSRVVGYKNGVQGAQIPKGCVIEKVQVVVEKAFTSSGTIGSSTLVLGLIKDDFTTENDYDGFTTSSLTGSGAALATVNSVKTIEVGTTGAGVFISTAGPTNPGYITVANSAHASHPWTDGLASIRIYWRFDDLTS